MLNSPLSGSPSRPTSSPSSGYSARSVLRSSLCWLPGVMCTESDGIETDQSQSIYSRILEADPPLIRRSTKRLNRRDVTTESVAESVAESVSVVIRPPLPVLANSLLGTQGIASAASTPTSLFSQMVIVGAQTVIIPSSTAQAGVAAFPTSLTVPSPVVGSVTVVAGSAVSSGGTVIALPGTYSLSLPNGQISTITIVATKTLSPSEGSALIANNVAITSGDSIVVTPAPNKPPWDAGALSSDGGRNSMSVSSGSSVDGNSGIPSSGPTSGSSSNNNTSTSKNSPTNGPTKDSTQGSGSPGNGTADGQLNVNTRNLIIGLAVVSTLALILLGYGAFRLRRRRRRAMAEGKSTEENVSPGDRPEMGNDEVSRSELFGREVSEIHGSPLNEASDPEPKELHGDCIKAEMG